MKVEIGDEERTNTQDFVSTSSEGHGKKDTRRKIKFSGEVDLSSSDEDEELSCPL